MYGFIYMTTNLINGKKYIGKKTYDSAGVWKNYLGSGIYLKRAISKYGKENFTREIIDNCLTEEDLNAKEKHWINFYNAVKSNEFYNIAPGGDGGNVRSGYSEIEFALSEALRKNRIRETIPKGEDSSMAKLSSIQVVDIINRLKNNEFSSDIASIYGVGTGTIDDIRNHKTWKEFTDGISFDSIKGRKRPACKKVFQYDLKGNIIATYDNARIAEKCTGVGYKLISAVCNGSKLTAHGFVWRFEGNSFNKYATSYSPAVKVDQYDREGNFIKTWESEKEIKLNMNVNVCSVLNGRTKSAGGFYWCKHGEHFSIPEYNKQSKRLVV